MEYKLERSRILVHLRDSEPLSVFGMAEVMIDRPIFEMSKENQLELAERLLELSIAAGLVERINSREVRLRDVILVERVVKNTENDRFGSSYRTDAFYANDHGYPDSLPIVDDYYGELEKRLTGEGVGIGLEQEDSRTILE